MAKGGAKQRMSILQGRGADVCDACQEDVASLSLCITCGKLLCRECKMDHKGSKGIECSADEPNIEPDVKTEKK